MKRFLQIGLLAGLVIGLPALCHAQIQHVEPLNWWVGMKNPALQLLIHGTNVGETTPVINYPGVTIRKVNRADSKNYLFIDLLISPATKPGTLTIRFEKDRKMVYSYDYKLLARERDPAQLTGFNASDVVYLIVPDRFANGDYTNDVVAGMKENKVNRSFEGARHGGDIRGMINHLDYIADMGYTAIWPTVLLENDMPSYSYHGYSITNHYKVDPRFGTFADYKELASKARQKGIKLIFDEVLNHSGINYWWMNDLPFRNWINNNYSDTIVLTNHRRTVNQDKYASKYDKELMTKGWFDKTMPDMNGDNPFMANYLIQSSIWWIESLQLGGLRQDTYGYSSKQLLTDWSCRIKNEYPNFSMVGEEWSVNPLVASYWQIGKEHYDGYKSCLTSIMDFPLQMALVDDLKEPEGQSFPGGMSKLYEALANDFVYANPNTNLLMADNHDMDRIFTQLNEDVDLTKMALTYLLTIRGIPQIYYGTEILMQNTGHHKNDGLIRSDFPGGWKEDAVNAFTGNGLTADQKEMQSYMKKLLNWRKMNPVIATGETVHFAPFKNVYVYFRYTANQMVMVIMNKNKAQVDVDTKRFAEVLKTKTVGKNIITSQAVQLNQPIAVPPKTTLVLEIN